MKPIPFNRPTLTGNEITYLKQAIELGHSSGDGSFTKKCAALLEAATGAKKVLLTTSCTHALEMMAILLNLKEGDEFIVPSFTFVSTANAFLLRGAKPVFIDIRPDTLNMDEKQLESLITQKTRAIVPVHYAGVACEMDTILSVAKKHSVPVVEDNAHGLFGKYKGKNLGTLGVMAAQSFHETKNFGCGEGGALLLNDTSYIERAEIIREKGTDRSRFFRGLVDKYGWVDVGSSYVLSDLLASFLFAQLESKEKIQTKRKQVWDLYFKALSGWAKEHGVQLPHIPAHCDQAYHMFYLVFPTEKMRDSVMHYLKANQILGVFHYLPLNTSKMGLKLGSKAGECPVTEDISNRLLRLPFYNDLTETDQMRVIDTLLSFSQEQKIAA